MRLSMPRTTVTMKDKWGQTALDMANMDKNDEFGDGAGRTEWLDKFNGAVDIRAILRGDVGVEADGGRGVLSVKSAGEKTLSLNEVSMPGA